MGNSAAPFLCTAGLATIGLRLTAAGTALMRHALAVRIPRCFANGSGF